MAKDKPKADIKIETKASSPEPTEKVSSSESIKKVSSSEPTEKVIVPPKKEVKKSEPLVSFDRWFRANSVKKGYKPHWAEGMRAYADTTGRKTMSQWDVVFEKY